MTEEKKTQLLKLQQESHEERMIRRKQSWENMEPFKDDFNRLIIRPKKDVQDDRHHNKPNETKYSEAFLKNSIMLRINGDLEFFVDNSNLHNGFSRQYVWMELSTDMVFKTDDYNYDVDVACRNCNNTSSNKIAYVIQDTPEWDATIGALLNLIQSYRVVLEQCDKSTIIPRRFISFTTSTPKGESPPHSSFDPLAESQTSLSPKWHNVMSLMPRL